MKTTQDVSGFIQTHALGSHPGTSAQAALEIFLDGTFERQKATVYLALGRADPENRGLTAKQIEKVVLGEDARKRLTDLKKDGVVFPHPTERRPNPGSGKPAQVWYRVDGYIESLIKQQTEERRKMQIKVKELADACKEASKAFNALFIASKAAAAAQERLNTAADAFTPKEQATVVEVSPEDFAGAEPGPQIVPGSEVQTDPQVQGEPQFQGEPLTPNPQITQPPQGGTPFGGMPGMTGMPGAQPAAQPQTNQPQVQTAAQPASQFGNMPGMAGMPGAQQPAAQPQQQPAAQPQDAQQPAGANGQITPDALQREIMGAMQRTPAVMQHINTVMMPRYCPQGGGIHAIPYESYVSFLDEVRQAEATLSQGGVLQ